MKFSHFLLIVCAVFVLSACSFTLAADVTPPPGYQPPPVQPTSAAATTGPLYPLVAPDPAKGEAIYAEKCAPCHGATGKGDGPQAAQLPNPAAAISSPEVFQNARPADWFQLVSDGNLERYMPPFQSLTTRQRWDVVAYSFAMGVPRTTLEIAAANYAEKCASCHGESGKGDGKSADSASLPDFTDQEYMAAKSAGDMFSAISVGMSSGMPGFAGQLTDEENWGLAYFLRSLTFASAIVSPAVQEPSATETVVTDVLPSVGSTPTVEASSPVSETETTPYGSVTGVVTNQSGGVVPSNLELTLNAFDHSEIVFTTTMVVQPDGSFAFDEVELLDGIFYLVTIKHQGVTYASTIGVFDPGVTSLELPVQIFDTTTDASILSVDRLHLFLEFIDEHTIRVVELYVISNPTSETLIAAGDGEPVLRFSLPQGASNLEFQDGSTGGRYVMLEDGFGDTTPIYPGTGEYQILFSYEIPYDRKLEFTRTAKMLTNAVVILVPEDGLKIKGDTIQDAGVRDVQGVLYHMYNGSAIPAGGALQLTLSGKPGGSFSLAGSSNTSLILGLGVLGAVLLVAGIWLYRRNSGVEAAEGEDDESIIEPREETSESIMDAILALDDLYQAGELPEEAYLQRRAELKERLKSLIG